MPSNMDINPPNMRSEWDKSNKIWNMITHDKVAKARTVVYTLLALFAISDLAVSSAVLNYSLVNSGEFLKSNAEIIVASCVTVLLVFANFTVLKNTFVTKIWFELLWLAICWVMYVGGTGTLHNQTPQLLSYCPTKYFICRGLIAILFLSSCAIVAISLSFLYLLGVCVYQSFRRHRKDIWFARVRDFEAFDGRMDGRRKKAFPGAGLPKNEKEDGTTGDKKTRRYTGDLSIQTSQRASTSATYAASTSPTGAPQLTLTTPDSSRDTRNFDLNPFVLELTPPSPVDEQPSGANAIKGMRERKKETVVDFEAK
ncbi:hypothetical protein BT69DRAFT_1318209 [Atractiella rhizophila]|nr:hypothetical protein BT69DRAFT_1318209 [Atractiella rhizophila]